MKVQCYFDFNSYWPCSQMELCLPNPWSKNVDFSTPRVSFNFSIQGTFWGINHLGKSWGCRYHRWRQSFYFETWRYAYNTAKMVAYDKITGFVDFGKYLEQIAKNRWKIQGEWGSHEDFIRNRPMLWAYKVLNNIYESYRTMHLTFIHIKKSPFEGFFCVGDYPQKPTDSLARPKYWKFNKSIRSISYFKFQYSDIGKRIIWCYKSTDRFYRKSNILRGHSWNHWRRQNLPRSNTS